MKQKGPIVAICGPTGVGKSDLAIYLAKELNGEIINFDSVQFYKDLNIGSAKPGEEERKLVRHHLFDILSPDEEFNAVKFVELADQVIEELWERKVLPIMVGGTGLYLRAFEYGIFEVKVKDGLREELKKKAEYSLKELYEELKKLDPEYAKKISPNDRVRIVRALEVIYSTGKKFSDFHKENPFFKKKRREIIKVGLILPREELYKRINQRVLRMIEKGWVEEVKALLEKGYPPDSKAFKAIGYKNLVDYLLNKISLEKAIKLIQRDTRRYAKRQITWFKKEPDITWFFPEEKEKVLKFVKERLSHGKYDRFW